MDSFDKKIVFNTLMDQCFNGGDFSLIDKYVAEGFTGYVCEPPYSLAGHEDLISWIKSIRSDFHDLNVLNEGNWLVAEDEGHHVGKGVTAERLAAYVVLRGTHRGTGRFVTWQQVHLIEFSDGRIKSDTVISDRLRFISGVGESFIEYEPPQYPPIPELI